MSSSTINQVGRKSVEHDSCKHTGLPHYFGHYLYEEHPGWLITKSCPL